MKFNRSLSGKKLKPNEQFGPTKIAVLNAINPRQMYVGTANTNAVSRRRAKSRVAKQSRKGNR